MVFDFNRLNVSNLWLWAELNGATAPEQNHPTQKGLAEPPCVSPLVGPAGGQEKGKKQSVKDSK